MTIHNIRTEAEYRATLKEILALVDADPDLGTPAGDRGIDPNSPSNGVALPKNAAAGDYSSPHGVRHCDKYHQMVETIVMGANDKEEVINALAAIRVDLLSGAAVVQGCD